MKLTGAHRWLVALLVVWPAMAAADAIVPPRPSSPPTAAQLAEAKTHYLAGAADYQQGDFARAIPEFTRAYALSGKPDLLYNIGVCYDNLREDEQALAFYQEYLAEKPDAPDARTVQAKVDVLSRSLAARRVAAAPASVPVTAPVQPPAPAPVAVPAPAVAAASAPASTPLLATTPTVPPAVMPEPSAGLSEGPRPLDARFFATGGAAVVLAGTAVTFFALEASANSALHSYPPTRADADADVRAANADNLVGWVTTVGALGAGAAAGYFYYQEHVAGERPGGLAVAPTRGGAALSFTRGF